MVDAPLPNESPIDPDHFRKRTAGQQKRSDKPKKPKRVTLDPTPAAHLIPGTHWITFEAPPRHVTYDEFAEGVWRSLRLYQSFYIRGGVVGVIDKDRFRFVPLTDRSMRALIERYIPLESWPLPKGGAMPELKRELCTLEMAGSVLEHPTQVDSNTKRNKHCPDLLAIAAHPLVTRDGKVLTGEWETAQGSIWTPPLRKCEPVPIWPFIADFKMSETSKAHLLALLLTAMFRPMLDANAPAFLVTSPIERSGKTKLVEDVVGCLMLGEPMSTIQWPKDEDEVDKRIIALLLGCVPMANIDNVPGEMDSPSFASLITASRPGGRILGQSLYVSCPNTITMVVTGNHVRLSAELAKRFCVIELNPGVESPELRVNFTHQDLRAAILENRAGILAWLVSLVDEWVAMGRPKMSRPFGGFERWGATVGGIVEHVLRLPILEDRADRISDMDEGGEDLKNLSKAWIHVYGHQWVSATDLLPVAQSPVVRAWAGLLDVAKSPVMSLGRKLAMYVGRTVGDVRLERAGTGSRRLYRLMPTLTDPGWPLQNEGAA